MTSTATMPEVPAYSHSLKLVETAKGVRISVHIYAVSSGEAIEASIPNIPSCKMKAIDNKDTISAS